VLRQIKEISDSDWAAIHDGNLGVCESMTSFKDFFTEDSKIHVAGKTGTAQQIKTRPNHALFVGYAPFDDPQMSVAVRIAYGYTSHNTADLAGDIFKYYFKLEDPENLITGQAAYTGAGSNSFGD
jgi:penicillin-binding protein 2